MSCATSVDDARTRAAKLLEVLEKSISAHASSGAITDLQRVCVWAVISFNGMLTVLLEFDIGNFKYNNGVKLLVVGSNCGL